MRLLPQYEIRTVVSMRWGGLKNGELLGLIARECFDAFVTGDKNMRNQQELEGRPFPVLIMSTINWPVVRAYIATIAAALEEAQPGTVTMIDCGIFKPHS